MRSQSINGLKSKIYGNLVTLKRCIVHTLSYSDRFVWNNDSAKAKHISARCEVEYVDG